MIKLFRIKSFAYTPFTNKDDISYLKENGIEIVDDISQADILVSQNFKHLKKYFWRYLKSKDYLVWTLEPRFDLSFSSTRKILFGTYTCHFMNIYTGDVYTSINPFHKRTSNNLKFLDSDFKLTNKKIVALMSYYQGPDAQKIIRNGENLDLIALRSKVALEGKNRGAMDIFGSGWPANISIENSRGGGWPERKEEILDNYHFNFCFENTITPNYITEKIWDSIGSYCLPIYYGKGTNIYNVFPEESFIDYSAFENPAHLFDYIKEISNEEFIDRLNKCIQVYKDFKEEDEVVTWGRKKESLDKIVQKCLTITNHNYSCSP